MSTFPHRLRVERPGTVVGQDEDTGAPVYSEPEVLYDGPADVQDVGEVLERDATGAPRLVSDARAFLARRGIASQLDKDLPVFIDWRDGTTDDARIVRVVRLDDSLHLRWV